MSFHFRCTAFVGITVDGYIARPDGAIDYLPPAPTTDGQSVPVCNVPTISDMLANSDVLVLGRNTYETVISFGEDQWPYGDKRLLLLTSRAADDLKLRPGVKIANSMDDAVDIIQRERFLNVWVDGGKTVSSFLRRGLISEMILSTVPIAIGSGIALFQGLENDVKLEIVASDVLDNLLATKYRVIYDESNSTSTTGDHSNGKKT